VKDNEAVDVLALLKGAFPAHRMDPTDRDVWLGSLSPLDADLAYQAVMRGRNEWSFFPPWSVFMQGYRMQQHLREPAGEQRQDLPLTKGLKLPLWIRRWAAARYLYRRFGRDQDMRPFREQSKYVDPLTKEWMPDAEWLQEAEHVTDADVWANVRG